MAEARRRRRRRRLTGLHRRRATLRERVPDHVPARPRRRRQDEDSLRRHRFPRDVLRRPERTAGRPHPGRARQGRHRAARPRASGRRSSREGLAPRRPRCAGGGGAGARQRAAPDARRARERGHLPDVPHDARPVRLADRAADQALHPRADRRRRHEERRSSRSSSPQFGDGVLAEPPKHGFDLLAWVLPIAGILVGAVRRSGCWRGAGAVGAGLPRPAARAAARPRARAAPRRGARPLRLTCRAASRSRSSPGSSR